MVRRAIKLLLEHDGHEVWVADGWNRLMVDDPLQSEAKLPRRDSKEDYIVIPPTAREWALSDFPFSVRLQHILASRECRRLGDLHGLRFSRILRWRNVGGVTLRRLIAFIKSVQQGDWVRRGGSGHIKSAGQ